MFRKETESRKSREQKFYEFFESLQLEYITAELRYLIYPDGEKRQKSLDIMEKKKEKIKDIVTRNSLKCIFMDITVGCTNFYDPELRKRLYAKIYPELGFPNFVYRDDLHRSQIEHLDRRFYYTIGSRFRTITGGEGILRSIDTKAGIAYIELCAGSSVSYSTREISRVF